MPKLTLPDENTLYKNPQKNTKNLGKRVES